MWVDAEQKSLTQYLLRTSTVPWDQLRFQAMETVLADRPDARSNPVCTEVMVPGKVKTRSFRKSCAGIVMLSERPMIEALWSLSGDTKKIL